MSTYNWMSCEDCKTQTQDMILVQRVSGTHIDNSEVLIAFLIKHRGHNLQLFSEHDDDKRAYLTDNEKGISE